MGYAVLLRHGRSTANAEGILAGRTPGVTLHEDGRREAHLVAAEVRGFDFASVHVSPMDRTRETARIVLPQQHHIIAPAIQECDYGDWSGRSLQSLSDEPLWKELHNMPSAVRFPNGESITEVAQRCTEYVCNIAMQDGLHLFVTHADPIQMVAAAAVGAPLDAYQRWSVDTCSITIINVSSHGMRLIASNIPARGVQAHLDLSPR